MHSHHALHTLPVSPPPSKHVRVFQAVEHVLICTGTPRCVVCSSVSCTDSDERIIIVLLDSQRSCFLNENERVCNGLFSELVFRLVKRNSSSHSTFILMTRTRYRKCSSEQSDSTPPPPPILLSGGGLMFVSHCSIWNVWRISHRCSCSRVVTLAVSCEEQRGPRGPGLHVLGLLLTGGGGPLREVKVRRNSLVMKLGRLRFLLGNPARRRPLLTITQRFYQRSSPVPQLTMSWFLPVQ